jgi:1,2-diacylglycerol 3-beta-glucosyltransferase
MNSAVVQVGIALAQAIALMMSVAFITYVVIIFIPFARHRARRPGDGAWYGWHLFVPALNEEAVIGDTVDYLRSTFPAARVWVIDDGSTDQTAVAVAHRAQRDPGVVLISRALPEAQQGKGEALNAAYRALVRSLPPDADWSRLIVGVVDADGRPAPTCLDVIAGETLFGDPGVGSVQVLVRMMNRYDRRPFPQRGRLVNGLGHILVLLQDLEFRVAISAIQLTRGLTKTVGLGGNGQFTRLSALQVVAAEDGRPWHGALLEDYELSLHLLMTGHRNEYTEDTYVDQEGLPDLRRLIRQRTRWGQGTMQCGVYLRRLWTNKHVSPIGALEATYYLFQPWMQLIGTLVYPIPAAVFFANYAAGPAEMRAWLASGGWMLAVFYCVLGLGPFIIWGPAYLRRCEPQLGLAKALGLGLCYSAYVLMFYLTSWRAFVRIVRHRQEWVKTQRNSEYLAPAPRHARRAEPLAPWAVQNGPPVAAQLSAEQQFATQQFAAQQFGTQQLGPDHPSGPIRGSQLGADHPSGPIRGSRGAGPDVSWPEDAFTPQEWPEDAWPEDDADQPLAAAQAKGLQVLTDIMQGGAQQEQDQEPPARPSHRVWPAGRR